MMGKMLSDVTLIVPCCAMACCRAVDFDSVQTKKDAAPSCSVPLLSIPVPSPCFPGQAVMDVSISPSSGDIVSGLALNGDPNDFTTVQSQGIRARGHSTYVELVGSRLQHDGSCDSPLRVQPRASLRPGAVQCRVDEA